jgi:DNA-binding MarR family transcriptional regulator
LRSSVEIAGACTREVYRGLSAGLAEDSSFRTVCNIVLLTTNQEDSGVLLLRAYLEGVTLSETLQSNIWQTAELTLVQVRALRKLAKKPRSLGQLGSDLALAPPSMTRLVDRLEERGLIERRRDDEDRRKVVATVTEEGRRLVSAVVPFLEGTAMRTAVDRMSVVDRKRIAAALRDFNSAVRQVEEELLLAGVEA